MNSLWDIELEMDRLGLGILIVELLRDEDVDKVGDKFGHNIEHRRHHHSTD